MQGIDSYENNSESLMLEQFVITYQPLVKKIALHIKRRLPSHIELQDLLQSGFIGLLEARRQFKQNMGASFETYASIRIRGCIIDSLRKNSWGTRESIKKMRRINDAILKIEQKNQKKASNDEIAMELGISNDEYADIWKKIAMSNVVCLDLIDENQLASQNILEDPQNISLHAQLKGHIKEAILLLSEREQMVLSLYYLYEFTFKQIGEILSLTEARICQLHSQAISHIQITISQDHA